MLTSQVAGPYEYTYRRGKDIDSYPIYGELHVYSGGGYVAELRGDRATIYDKIAELKAGGWIDKYTRAVFLELAVYNPNVCVTLSFVGSNRVGLFTIASVPDVARVFV